MECYHTVYTEGTGEIVEKKSRFIAEVFPVSNEEEAFAHLEEIRKKHWDARHHCFAYVIGDRHELARFSDDGEPGGTAGKPMLDVLMGEDIHNVAVVGKADTGSVKREKTDRCICCCHQILWRHASRNRRSCKSVYVGGGRGACSYGYYNQDTWV